MSSEESPTQTGLPPTPAPEPAIDRGHFASGTVLAGRYRIVALLGKGGMGEVYRADDLKLAQPVALKFLPERLAFDPSRLARFLQEVRVARGVSHPNVCRVYDIGEAEGLHFLTMEYVDGEDLASLLRRIGRLPQDKAVEIARQICVGLAAVHDRGVLHRDLKPANIMIDGRGRARLTDFGLAVATGEGGLRGEIAGTPAYMAPELLEGRGPSVRSDVYALGLVLYEILAGRPPFRAESTAEVVRLHREATPPRPSSLVAELDPALERLVLSCLQKDPARRPASALAAAAALPGGDPLAALLAAGETPPPEMLAAAGRTAGLRPGAAWACLAFVLIGLPVLFRLTETLVLFRQVPLEKPPEVLADRARELLRGIGPPGAGASSAYGFAYAQAAPGPFAPEEALARPAPIHFWYRQSPTRMDALNAYGTVRPEDPPLTSPGMTMVRLDTRGRLIQFLAVPPAADAPATETGAADAPPDWDAILAAAGLELAAFREVPPALAPPVFADGRMAWEGTWPEEPRVPVRVEAASHGGRLVSFRILGPWNADAEAPRASAAATGFAVVFFVSLAFGAALAVRNLRLGRGDRTGAIRLGAAAFALRLVVWLLQTPHTSDLAREQTLFIHALGRALYVAALVSVLYLAIEPTVRRRWPDSLISWSRVLVGRLRDPLVGRDVLVGMVFAVAMVLVWVLGRLAPTWWGAPPAAPVLVNLDFLLGPRPFLAWLLFNMMNALLACLIFTVLFVLLRALVRSEWLAMAACILLFTFLSGVAGRRPTEVLAVALVMALVFLLLARFGFLAAFVTVEFLGTGRLHVPVTLDLGAWYGQASLWWLLTGAGIALYGFYVSLAGRPILRAGILEE